MMMTRSPTTTNKESSFRSGSVSLEVSRFIPRFLYFTGWRPLRIHGTHLEALMNTYYPLILPFSPYLMCTAMVQQMYKTRGWP